MEYDTWKRAIPRLSHLSAAGTSAHGSTTSSTVWPFVCTKTVISAAPLVVELTDRGVSTN